MNSDRIREVADEFNKEKLLDIYYRMKLIRSFEDNIMALYKRNLCYGGMHLSAGEEACAVGSCLALDREDKIVTSHRGHGHNIAKGADINRMTAELMGRKTGLCKGKGGSMHILDMSCGAMGAQGIVGAQIAIAVGIGFSLKMKKKSNTVVSFFGDGASNTGSFHESLNMAATKCLPVVFVCQNNGYAITFPVKKSVKPENIADRASGYGIPGVVADGNNVLEVYDTVRDAVSRAKKGHGPTLVELKTYRLYGHYIGDACEYRPKEEEEYWRKERDPIRKFSSFLTDNGYADENDIKDRDEKVKITLQEANEFAENSPDPEEKDLYEDVYYEGDKEVAL